MTGGESDGRGGDQESTSKSQANDTTTHSASYQLSRPCDIPVHALPPLPTPDNDSKRRETIGGIAIVTLFMAIFIGLTHGVALTAIGSVDKGSFGYTIFVSLIYAESVIGILCHVGILCRDPGVIQRSSTTCFPIPDKMQAWVSANASDKCDDGSSKQQSAIEGKQQPKILNDGNVYENAKLTEAGEETATGPASPRSEADSIDANIPENEMNDKTADPEDPLQKPRDLYIAGADDRVYCTRCLIWRQPGINHFHCQTCQRCVGYYDHHCTFFGRCIAGTLYAKPMLRGNFVFFVGIVAMGGMGYATTIAALLYSLSLRFGVKWVLSIGFALLLWLHTAILKRSPRALCMMCRRVTVDTCEFVRRCVINKRG